MKDKKNHEKCDLGDAINISKKKDSMIKANTVERPNSSAARVSSHSKHSGINIKLNHDFTNQSFTLDDLTLDQMQPLTSKLTNAHRIHQRFVHVEGSVDMKSNRIGRITGPRD